MCIVCCSVNAVDAAYAAYAAENVVKSVPKAIIPSQSFFLPYPLRKRLRSDRDA